MRKHLLPYGDFLAYCLMPNHFHWLFYVRHISVGVTSSHPVTFERDLSSTFHAPLGASTTLRP
jgi:hypothetical protein